MTTAKTRNRPGRPAQQESFDARRGIIDAACAHFASHGIKGSSNKQIAAQAGVTAAMIHYYFRNKQALYKAVLEACFTDMLDNLSSITTLEQWVHAFHSHLRQRLWLPHLMIREVLTPNGLLRPLFLKHFAPHIFSFVRQLMAQTVKTRKSAAGFDIDRHVVLLMGLMVYPFISMELAQNLTGRSYDRQMLDGFRDDALKLFMNGVAAKQER